MPTQADVDESLDIGDQELGFGKDAEMKKYSDNSMKRVCEICWKEFSSGKALGGHMSSHVQLKKNMSLKKEEKQGSDLMGKMNHGCAICGKRFQSMKALSGHMRRHPERPWRGINPPSPKTTPSVDLTESLKRWPVTGKRGRKPIPAAEVGPLSDGVFILMMLSRGEGGKRLSKDEVSEVVEVKVMEMRNQEEKEKYSNLSELEDDGHCKSKLNVMMKNKKRKKVKLCDLSLRESRDHKDLSTHDKLGFDSSPTTQTGILNIDLNRIPSW